MACKKYSGWIVEAALDALSPQRKAELSVHFADCRACREEFEHARTVSGVIDHSLAALVATEPSPHFQAKLRARLASEQVPQRAWRFGWASVGALAAVLIAAVAMVAVRVGQTRRSSLGLSVANSVANVDASKAQPAGINPSAQTGARSDGGEVVSEPDRPSMLETTTRTDRLEATPHMERAKLSPRGHQPEVLVPPGQMALIERFAQAAREGRVDSAQIVNLGGDDAAPLDVQAIEIAPLKIQGLPHPDDSNTSNSSDSPDTGKS